MRHSPSVNNPVQTNALQTAARCNYKYAAAGGKKRQTQTCKLKKHTEELQNKNAANKKKMAVASSRHETEVCQATRGHLETSLVTQDPAHFLVSRELLFTTVYL